MTYLLRRGLVLVHALFLWSFLTTGYADEPDDSLRDEPVASEEVGEESAATPLDDSTSSNLFCARFNGHPFFCNREPGCTFDYRTARCFRFTDGNINHWSYCPRYNYEYGNCVNSGCFFDNRTGLCFRGSAPYPYPNARQFVCLAFDATYEMHGGGHRGYGMTRDEAFWNALRQCEDEHYRPCRVTTCRML